MVKVINAIIFSFVIWAYFTVRPSYRTAETYVLNGREKGWTECSRYFSLKDLRKELEVIPGFRKDIVKLLNGTNCLVYNDRDSYEEVQRLTVWKDSVGGRNPILEKGVANTLLRLGTEYNNTVDLFYYKMILLRGYLHSGVVGNLKRVLIADEEVRSYKWTNWLAESVVSPVVVEGDWNLVDRNAGWLLTTEPEIFLNAWEEAIVEDDPLTDQGALNRVRSIRVASYPRGKLVKHENHDRRTAWKTQHRYKMDKNILQIYYTIVFLVTITVLSLFQLMRHFDRTGRVEVKTMIFQHMLYGAWQGYLIVPIFLILGMVYKLRPYVLVDSSPLLGAVYYENNVLRWCNLINYDQSWYYVLSPETYLHIGYTEGWINQEVEYAILNVLILVIRNLALPVYIISIPILFTQWKSVLGKVEGLTTMSDVDRAHASQDGDCRGVYKVYRRDIRKTYRNGKPHLSISGGKVESNLPWGMLRLKVVDLDKSGLNTKQDLKNAHKVRGGRPSKTEILRPFAEMWKSEETLSDLQWGIIYSRLCWHLDCYGVNMDSMYFRCSQEIQQITIYVERIFQEDRNELFGLAIETGYSVSELIQLAYFELLLGEGVIEPEKDGLLTLKTDKLTFDVDLREVYSIVCKTSLSSPDDITSDIYPDEYLRLRENYDCDEVWKKLYDDATYYAVSPRYMLKTWLYTYGEYQKRQSAERKYKSYTYRHEDYTTSHSYQDEEYTRYTGPRETTGIYTDVTESDFIPTDGAYDDKSGDHEMEEEPQEDHISLDNESESEQEDGDVVNGRTGKRNPSGNCIPFESEINKLSDMVYMGQDMLKFLIEIGLTGISGAVQYRHAEFFEIVRDQVKFGLGESFDEALLELEVSEQEFIDMLVIEYFVQEKIKSEFVHVVETKEFEEGMILEDRELAQKIDLEEIIALNRERLLEEKLSELRGGCRRQKPPRIEDKKRLIRIEVLLAPKIQRLDMVNDLMLNRAYEEKTNDAWYGTKPKQKCLLWA